MNDWIEDGESGASVRAKLNSLRGTGPTTNVAPTDQVITGQDAAASATGANINGADLVLAGGRGKRSLTIVDYTALSGIWIDITVDGVTTEVIEGSDFTAATSNAATATAIAAALATPSTGPAITAVAVGVEVVLYPPVGSKTVEIDTSASGGSITTTLGADGVAHLYPWTEVLANDPSTTTGLTYGYKGGLMHFFGVVEADNLHIDPGTVNLTDNASNTIYWKHGFGVRAIVLNALPAPTDAFTMAVVVTSGGQITEITDLRHGFYTNSGKSRLVISDFATDRANTSGLTFAFEAGYLATPAGTLQTGGSISLTDDATNYVELDVTGNILKNTVGFTPGNCPVAEVTTSGGEITSAFDRRGFMFAPGPGPKHKLVAGAAAGNITVSGIKSGDRLDEVIANTSGTWSDLTAEFSITADDTINNGGGTNTTGKQLMVRWTKLTA